MRGQGMNGEARAEQLTNAGWALFRAGNLHAAARDFGAALAADPDHINALLGITQTHSAFGEFAEAEAAADRLLAINPNLPQAHRVKCDLLRRMRMPHEARIHAEQSIKLDPMEPLGYHYLAVIFYGWKDYRKALKVIAEGRKVAPWYGVLAAQEARYEFLSFVDDDNWVTPDWVAIVHRTFTHLPHATAFGGRGEPAFEREPAKARGDGLQEIAAGERAWHDVVAGEGCFHGAVD